MTSVLTKHMKNLEMTDFKKLLPPTRVREWQVKPLWYVKARGAPIMLWPIIGAK